MPSSKPQIVIRPDSESERAQINKAARERGLSVSDWILSLVRQHIATPKPYTPLPFDEVSK